MDINGKVAWITGGNSGMGAATAKLFVEKGAKVLITGRSVTAGGAEVAEALGENCLWIKADNTVLAELEAAAETAVRKWGKMDILVNCAGGSPPGGVIITEDRDQINAAIKDMEDAIKLNLMGSFHTARIAANYMAKNEPGYKGERGSIIFIASMAADKIWMWPPEGTPPTWFGYGYGATKAAILGLSRDLAFRLGEFGIRVNTVKPGYIKTPLTAWAQQELEKTGNPMQLYPKFGGEPEDIAQLCAAIVENTFINRAEYEIDAGVVG